MEELTVEQLTVLADICFKANKNSSSTVFFNYSGHINEAEVDIHFNGWKAGEMSDYMYRSVDTGSKNYAECIKILEDLAGGKEN